MKEIRYSHYCSTLAHYAFIKKNLGAQHGVHGPKIPIHINSPFLHVVLALEIRLNLDTISCTQCAVEDHDLCDLNDFQIGEEVRHPNNLCVRLLVSLYLSLARAHVHTRTNRCTLTHTYTHTHTLSHSHSHSLSHSLSLSHIFTLNITFFFLPPLTQQSENSDDPA